MDTREYVLSLMRDSGVSEETIKEIISSLEPTFKIWEQYDSVR